MSPAEIEIIVKPTINETAIEGGVPNPEEIPDLVWG